MATVDELRKTLGLYPIFIPSIADILIPDNETTKEFANRRKLIAKLIQKDQEDKLLVEEYNLVEKLKNNNILALRQCLAAATLAGGMQ